MPEALTIIFSGFLGVAIGSFLNVVILRSGRGESPLKGRSKCQTCGQELSWKELIPVASYVIQKGRCLHCGAVLSLQYPLVELATGILFAITAWQYLQYPVSSIQYLSIPSILVSVLILSGFFAVISSFLVILLTDLYWQIIPDGATLVLTLVGVGATITRRFYCVIREIPSSPTDAGIFYQNSCGGWPAASYDLLFAICFLLFFAALWFFSKGRGMGFGDVKLIFATSLLLGFPASLAAFLFSFWLGGLTGAALLVFNRGGLKTKIPLGPFILAGSVIAYFTTDKFLAASGLYHFL